MFTIYMAANIGSARCKGPNKETPKGPEWRFAPTGSAGHFHIVVAAHIMMMMCLSSSPFLFLHREIVPSQKFPRLQNETDSHVRNWLAVMLYIIWWDPTRLVKSRLISASGFPEAYYSPISTHNKKKERNERNESESPVRSYIEGMDGITWPRKVFLFFFFHPLAWQWNLGASQPVTSEEKIRLSSSSSSFFFSWHRSRSWKLKLWKDLIKLSKQITAEENNMKKSPDDYIQAGRFRPDGTNRSLLHHPLDAIGQRHSSAGIL